MKKYNLQLGALIATIVALSVLPVRLSEGQGSNPFNLIGSEIVICMMCMSVWTATYQVYYHVQMAKWKKMVISFLICAALSNLFYWGSNPFFEDYPLRPMRELPFWIATMRLSIRGLLVGLMMVPIIFLIENERQRQREELAREKERVKDAEHQKQLLEKLVSERTLELERTLTVLGKSQDELDHQVYLLSRVVASIAHDVNAPLRYIISGAELVGKHITNRQFEEAAEYNQQMKKSLSSMAAFMQNLLEFAREQIHSGSLHMENVDLAALISEKAGLFEQILYSGGNTLEISLYDDLSVFSNANLLGVMLHNLLDNATKNTESGKIEILAKVVDDQLHLIIQNTVSKPHRDLGTPQGAPGSAQQWDISKTDGTGLGLLLVRDISSLLNVRFLIEATADMVAARIIFNEFSSSGKIAKRIAAGTSITEDARN
jgi:signal transduction histidine kinase